jgi:hypothetical protein
MTAPSLGARQYHVNAESREPNFGFFRFGVPANIGFVQKHDRHRPAFPGRNQVTLYPHHAEIFIQTGDDENRIDIRGNHLFIRCVPRDFATKNDLSGENRVNHCFRLAGHLYRRLLVVHGGKSALALYPKTEFARYFAIKISTAVTCDIAAIIYPDYPHRRIAAGPVFFKKLS